MNRRQKYMHQIRSIIGALLLLVVFLTPILTEALHQHPCYFDTSGVNRFNTVDHDEYTSPSKCNVCEVIKDQLDSGLLMQKLSWCLKSLSTAPAGFPSVWNTSFGFMLSSLNRGPPNSFR